MCTCNLKNLNNIISRKKEKSTKKRKKITLYVASIIHNNTNKINNPDIKLINNSSAWELVP